MFLATVNSKMLTFREKLVSHSLIIIAIISPLLVISLENGYPGEWKNMEIVNSYNLTNLQDGDLLQDSTTVTFEAGQNNTGTFVLDTILKISNKHSLRFRGLSGSTAIKCSGGSHQTGMIFNNVTNLYIESLHLDGCGVSCATTPGGQGVVGGLNIINCTNVTINDVTIKCGRGVGLVIVNGKGRFHVQRSKFIENGLKNQMNYTRGGGIFIDQSNINTSVSMTIKDCSFISNLSPSSMSATDFIYFQPDKTKNILHEKGGGLYIMIGEHAKSNSLNISECIFLENYAMHGGGVHAMIKDSAQENVIIFHKNIFRKNNCRYGGGGLRIGYIPNITEKALNNQILIQHCTFTDNSAVNFGGGLSVTSTMGPLFDLENEIIITNCTWTENQAWLASAVDISVLSWETYTVGRYLPSVVFNDCTFDSNSYTNVSSVYQIVGTFITTGFKVIFHGRTRFINNKGTGVKATSTSVHFGANSNTEFINNKGAEGGAMAFDLALLYVADNTRLYFKQNIAIVRGGAISFKSSDFLSFTFSKSCVIQPEPKEGGQSHYNISLVFRDNIACYSDNKSTEIDTCNQGNSVFASTLIPCFALCGKHWADSNDSATTGENLCFGKFGFEFSDSNRKQFSTEAHHFMLADDDDNISSLCMIAVNETVVRKNPAFNINRLSEVVEKDIQVIPGGKTIIPLKLVDDLCREINFNVYVRVKKISGTLYIHSSHKILTGKNIILYGEPKSTGIVELVTVGTRKRVATLKVELLKCPPGFIEDKKSRKCECSSDTNNKKYTGIERCDSDNLTAYRKRGYWVGYLNETGEPAENYLATALCPSGYCFTRIDNNEMEYKLPRFVSENFNVCSANRTGLLCGECKKNMSTHFHSTEFNCGSNELCHLGWLFYFLSELVPVTLLFLTVILCDISFTTGTTNGIIFFMQFTDTMKLHGDGAVNTNGKTAILFWKTFKIVYRMFSMNFFSIKELSFCLWPGASTMDMLSIKYVTIVYGLLLIIVTVLVLKTGVFQRVCKIRKFQGLNFSPKHSIIHGLSAFLIMSYSECTRVSILIITSGTLTIGPEVSRTKTFVPYYMGSYNYFEAKHLYYAIPALAFLIVIGIIPPILLLGYPLCYKLLACLRIEESWCLRLTCKILPLEKIKPIFDSFQGTFKDRFRFFAGLYFIYRLLALVIFSLSQSFNTHYALTSIALVIMLTLHAICRPYRESWHNIVDTLLFTNLIIINAMSAYNYNLSTGSLNNQNTVEIVNTVQSILILLPLIYLILYIGYYCFNKLKVLDKCRAKVREKVYDTSDDILSVIDNRDLTQSQNEMSDYQLLNNIDAEREQNN